MQLNLDGLVGPTHHFGGQSYGNLASMAHGGQVSSPRRAALEGLEKMRVVRGLGVAQGVLPPQERPDLAALRRLGFSGSDARMLERAAREAPDLLSACASAASMWAANAATVSPSADTADGRVHLTPANLVTQFHRSLEPPGTAAALRAVLPPGDRFVHHDSLPATPHFADEGAANHLRLAGAGPGPGVEVFVSGRQEVGRAFPARQSEAACRSLARVHGLDPRRTVFACQHPGAIAAGAFHNDVVAVASGGVLLCHEQAFADLESVLPEIREAMAPVSLIAYVVPASRLPLETAVSCYLFNSQVVPLGDGSFALVAPQACRDAPEAMEIIAEWREEVPLGTVVHVPLQESMANGGGPACLRLRVELTGEEFAAVHPGVLLDDTLLARLTACVERHYRDRLALSDLADPELLAESRRVLDELTGILDLGTFYPFQRDG